MNEKQRYLIVREIAELQSQLLNIPVAINLNWFQKRRHLQIKKRLLNAQSRLDALNPPSTATADSP